METNSALLSIQTGLYGLSFYMEQNGDGIFNRIPYETATVSGLDEILEKITDELWRNFHPAKVVVLHHHELNAFVPAELFVPEKAKEFLRYNVKLLPSDTVEADTGLPYDTVNVFVPYENVNNFFIDRFGEIEFHHSASAFLKYAAGLTAGQTDVFVRFSEKDFQMLILNPDELLFYNRFPMETQDDFLYYFFFVWEKRELNRLAPQVFLLGDEKQRLAARENLRDFITGVHELPEAEKEILKVFL